jgi:hypothetical protein
MSRIYQGLLASEYPREKSRLEYDRYDTITEDCHVVLYECKEFVRNRVTISRASAMQTPEIYLHMCDLTVLIIPKGSSPSFFSLVSDFSAALSMKIAWELSDTKSGTRSCLHRRDGANAKPCRSPGC